MLRIIHAQTVSGAILIDDLDDGMPNKQVYRLSSTADPKSYVRDGYANDVKQKCYVSRTKPGNSAIAGYIDLNQTQRVQLSADKGKISRLKAAGLITVVSFVASDLTTPNIVTADKDTPGAGDLTITGTNFLSVAPNESSVALTGTGAVTLTRTQVLTGAGTWTNTSIVIPAALIPGVAVTTTSARVTADDANSNTVALT